MKKILILLAFSFNIAILPAADQARRAKFASGINNWTQLVQSTVNNYANSSLDNLTDVLKNFDIFENAFKNVPKSFSDQQNLNKIRQSLNELIERKKRELQPAPSSTVSQTTIPQPPIATPVQPQNLQAQFATELGDWSNKLQNIGVNIASISLELLTSTLNDFTSFENNFNNVNKSEVQQTKLNNIRDTLNDFIDQKRGAQQPPIQPAQPQDLQAQFATEFDQWNSKIRQISDNIANTSLELLTSTLSDFNSFNNQFNNVNKSEFQQDRLDSIRRMLNDLIDQKRGAQQPQIQPAQPQDLQDQFATELAEWNAKIKQIRETIIDNALELLVKARSDFDSFENKFYNINKSKSQEKELISIREIINSVMKQIKGIK